MGRKNTNSQQTVTPRELKNRSPFATQLAQRIKTRIDELKIDYRELSARTGGMLSPTMINKYVLTGIEMRMSRLLILCLALDMPLRELLPPEAVEIAKGRRTPRSEEIVRAGYFSNPKGKK